MSTYRYLTDLADAARASGLRVVELDGWKSRGRDASHGGFNPGGVLCHHTGDSADGLAYAKWLATVGRSDLPAPLVQLSLGRDGTVYVCAAGRANHAGEAKAVGPMAGGDGNYIYVGIEAQNTGTEGWGHKATTVSGEVIDQGEAYARLCAALCTHYGWSAQTVRAHKETSVTGKWDPGALDMNKHRARVAAIIAEGVDDVSAADVWTQKVAEFDDSTKDTEVSAGVLLAQAHNRAGDARKLAADAKRAALATQAGVEALAAAFEKLVPGVQDAVTKALKDAVVNVDVNVAGGDTAS